MRLTDRPRWVLPVLLAASLASGLAGVALARWADRRNDDAVPPGVRANGRAADAAGSVTGDLDGDDRGDEVTLLVWRHDQEWLGLRADLSGSGRRTTWLPWTADAEADPRLAGTPDLDADGRAELVLSTAISGGRRHAVYALAGSELKDVSSGVSLQASDLPKGTTGWGCADGRVHVTLLSRGSDGSHRGIVRYFRFRDGGFVPDGSDDVVVPRGAAVPAQYTARVTCPGVAP